MVTLKSHKVYVGKPYLLLWDDPTQVLTFIKILPSKSGYRDPATKKVTLPTRYDELAERLVEINFASGLQKKDVTDPLSSDILGLTDESGEIVAQIDIEDLGVVIAWAEVESLIDLRRGPLQGVSSARPSQSIEVVVIHLVQPRHRAR